MNFSKAKWHELINVMALALAIGALPFSVSVCHAGLLLLIANWIIEGQWKNKWSQARKKSQLLPFILFFFLNAIGLFYAEDISNGLFAIEKKIFFFTLPFILATTIIKKEHLHFLLKLFIAASAVACIICLSVSFYHITTPPGRLPANFDFANSKKFKLLNPDISEGWAFLSYYELASGIRIHPTYLGIFTLFSIILLAYFYKKEENTLSFREKLCILFLFLFFSIFILMLSVRVVTLAYVFSCITVCWWIFADSGRHLLRITGVLFILAFSSISILINPIARYRSFQEFNLTSLNIEKNKLYTTSSSIRLSLWWLGLESIKNSNWLIGNGTGETIETMNTTAKKYGVTNTINSTDPHNQFIYTILSLGVIGLIVLLGCLLMPLIQQGLSVHFLYVCFISIVCIACLTESFLELQKGIVFFSLFNSLFIFQFQPIKVKASHA